MSLPWMLPWPPSPEGDPWCNPRPVRGPGVAVSEHPAARLASLWEAPGGAAGVVRGVCAGLGARQPRHLPGTWQGGLCWSRRLPAAPGGAPEVPAASSGVLGGTLVSQRSWQASRSPKPASTTPTCSLLFCPSPAPCVCVRMRACSPASVSALVSAPMSGSCLFLHLCLSACLWPSEVPFMLPPALLPLTPPLTPKFFSLKRSLFPMHQTPGFQGFRKMRLRGQKRSAVPRPCGGRGPKGSLGPPSLLVCLTYLFLTCPTWRNKEPAHPVPQGAPFLPSKCVMQEFLVF